MQENLSSVMTEEPLKIANKQEKKLIETIEMKPEGEMDDQVDMSGTNRNYRAHA